MYSKNVNLKNFITYDNIERAVKLRGMPFHVTPEQLVEFFRDFNITTSDVVIEQRNGKMTGFGLVFLANPDEAERAKRDLHRQYIGKRYVELSSPDPEWIER